MTAAWGVGWGVVRCAGEWMDCGEVDVGVVNDANSVPRMMSVLDDELNYVFACGHRRCGLAPAHVCVPGYDIIITTIGSSLTCM